MLFDKKANEGVSEKQNVNNQDICQSYITFMLQKYIEEKSRVCEYVSKRAASLVHSGFIVLEIVESIGCCIKFEVSFAVNSYSYN